MSTSNGTHDAVKNQLLSSFSLAEWVRLRPAAQLVSLTAGQVLYESGGRLDYIYFPTTAVISCLYTMRDGSIAEMTLIGNEGLVGIFLVLGSASSSNSAVVQIGGASLRIPAKLIRSEFERGGQLQHELLRYTQGLLTSISQAAVCNSLHTLEQRLCRWLLLCHDRVQRSEILMTHEDIALLLGGRRETVTLAAGHLQSAGVIHYSRGRITIIDSEELEKHACECYRAVEDELERLAGARDNAVLTSLPQK